MKFILMYIKKNVAQLMHLLCLLEVYRLSMETSQYIIFLRIPMEKYENRVFYKEEEDKNTIEL